MKSLLLLVVLVSSGCAIDPGTMESCKKLCSPRPIKELTVGVPSKCVCVEPTPRPADAGVR